MEALLRIQDLSVRYRTDNASIQCAVSGVSFEIGGGEVVGLVGESGCGKTSLGLALLGLHGDNAEVTGFAFLARRDLLTLDERSFQQIRGAKIALISQDLGLALSPVLRVGDQIAEVLHAHSGQSWNQCRTKAAGWLMRVGLTPARRMFSAFPHQLSGGQLQRVLLAQALICKPSLLIADEPTAALDVRNQAEFVALLSRLRAEFWPLHFVDQSRPGNSGKARRSPPCHEGRAHHRAGKIRTDLPESLSPLHARNAVAQHSRPASSVSGASPVDWAGVARAVTVPHNSLPPYCSW